MPSVVDICNVALARLGDNATVASIEPPEGSAQAEHCARFYPLARDSLLEMHPWRFATRRAKLARLDAECGEWAYAYAVPAQTIRILSVQPPGCSYQPQQYVTEATADGHPVILTNQPNATVRYIGAVSNSDLFPPLFVDALAWLLAAYLAGPVIKGDAGAAMAKICTQTFLATLSTARVSDANQQKVQPDHVPGWIAGR